MLARYKIHRGKLPQGVRLPDGVRQDTRKHTRHCLRPTDEIVTEYLNNPNANSWLKFSAAYLTVIASRYADDAAPFDELAGLASSEDVYIGCSCPTKNNPDVNHCHTVLALKFMSERYPELRVEFP